MDNAKLVENIEVLIGPIAQDCGCELVDVQITQVQRQRVVRIYIDKPGGVKLDDCTEVSRAVAAVFDVEDCIPGAYNLEVSSPGVDRPLRKKEHFERFAGEEVVVQTFEPIEGRRKFRGQLNAVEAEGIVLTVDQQQYTVPLGAISKAHLKGTIQTPQGKRS